ncbi:MAG: SGNH/GDSL hydrolase family protein [Nitrospirae bacterium]|nr:SGNH/GDSL hydrolase family protein [Nitrospirota bacterium]
MERVKKLLKSNTPVKWLFYGDSITHGSLHTFGQRDYAELFSERVRSELGRSMDIVITTAIGGNNTRDLLSGFDWRVAQFKPNVVFIMIGMNDCSENNDITIEEFESNLEELVRKTGSIGAIPVLQTTCPILPGQAPDRSQFFDLNMDSIRKIASVQGLPLIDHRQFWQDNSDKHSFWMSNAFHPNAYGHRAFAECLYRCLDIYDAASHSCRFYFP